ncbi:MAG TPA: ester cyclase [Ktedonobacterales bacterium]|nr:ester cyclase [Ktedonobacterales bacterium]
MDSRELLAFGTRYAIAWSSQQPWSVAEFFSEDGSLQVNDDAPAKGRAAIAGVAQGFLTAFPDMSVSMDEIEARPEGGVFHWTFTGTNTGPNGTGQRVRFSGYEEWTFGPDGLVADSKGHFDAEEYARQLEHGVSA